MGLSTIITLIAVVGVGYYIWNYTDIPDQVRQMMAGSGGKRTGGAPSAPSGGGGDGEPAPSSGGSGPQGNMGAAVGGLIFQGTGKTWSAKDSGKTTRNYASGGSSGTTQWDAKGVPANNIESTVDFDWGNCSDTMSIKHYGPDHSNGKCCWIIMNVDGAGKFFLGGEGPHPNTEKSNLATGSSMGSLKGKRVQVKFVTWIDSQVHARGYGFTGGKWVEYIKWDGSQFGANKKASKPASGANTQFRIDCSGIKIHSAVSAEINPPGSSAAAYARAMMAVPRRGRYTGKMQYLQRPAVSYMVNRRQYRFVPAI